MICLFPQLNLVGVKDDTPVHFCDKCGLPIKIYGRMVRNMSLKHNLYCWRSCLTFFFFSQIPCKHVFCYDCALHYEKKCDKMCPGWVSPTIVCLSGFYPVLSMFEVKVMLLKTHRVYPWYIKFGCSVPLNVACKVQANQENVLFPW